MNLLKDDPLEGGSGDDSLHDFSGINILNGEQGNDKCSGTSNSELIDCES